MTDTDLQVIERRKEKTLKDIAEELRKIEEKYPLISDNDINFIKARYSYLTPAQENLFAKLFVEENKELSYDELKAKAKELGINPTGIKKEELAKMIAEAQE